MMNIQEKFRDKGVFQSLKDANPDEYSKVFGNRQPDILDIDFLSSYGQRIVPNILQDTDTNTIALMIWGRFTPIWELSDEVPDWQNNVNMKTETTSNNGSTTTGNSTNNTNNDVYGFNDDTSTPQNDSTQKTTNQNNTQSNGTTTVTQTGRNNSNAFSDYNSYTRLVRRRLSTIYSDILSIVSIPVYGKDMQ